MLTLSIRACGPPSWMLLPLLLAPHALQAQASPAQAGIVRVARENFRAAPSGAVLAEVVSDTRLPLGERRDRWRQATLEGWVWSASLREERRDGHDLIVSARRGENLRASPNGVVLARLRPGMLVDRVEERGNWIRVRRAGWLWEPSLGVEDIVPAEVDEPAAVGGPAPSRASEQRVQGSDGGAGDGAERPSRGSAPGRSASPASGGDLAMAPSGAVVLESAAGDTLARVHPGATVQVLAREGNWARIRVEGWTSAASLASGDTGSGPVLRDIALAELADAPDRFRGRVLEWSIQFIAVQRAERFRTDFLEGESFILARGPGEDAGFVYVAVPPDRLEEVQRLTPLQRIRVLARVRQARSELTGAPVLDLMDLRPQER